MKFLCNNSLGFLCNFVFMDSIALFSIRKILQNKFNSKVKLIRNSDTVFVKKFKKCLSGSWVIFFKLEDKVSLKNLQSLEAELSSVKLDYYSMVNGFSLFSFNYLLKSLKVYNSEEWRFYNGLFITKFLSKSLNLPLVGLKLVLSTLCYNKAWQL